MIGAYRYTVPAMKIIRNDHLRLYSKGPAVLVLWNNGIDQALPLRRERAASLKDLSANNMNVA